MQASAGRYLSSLRHLLGFAAQGYAGRPCLVRVVRDRRAAPGSAFLRWRWLGPSAARRDRLLDRSRLDPLHRRILLDRSRLDLERPTDRDRGSLPATVPVRPIESEEVPGETACQGRRVRQKHRGLEVLPACQKAEVLPACQKAAWDLGYASREWRAARRDWRVEWPFARATPPWRLVP